MKRKWSIGPLPTEKMGLLNSFASACDLSSSFKKNDKDWGKRKVDLEVFFTELRDPGEVRRIGLRFY